MSSESNQSERWIDRPGQRSQSPAWVFRIKTGNINIYIYIYIYIYILVFFGNFQIKFKIVPSSSGK